MTTYTTYCKTTGRPIAIYEAQTSGGWAPQETETCGVIEGEYRADSCRIDHDSKTVRPYTPPPPEKPWQMLRMERYGPISMQLDMLYHDLRDGTTKWLEHIESVKLSTPKPTGDPNGAKDDGP